MPFPTPEKTPTRSSRLIPSSSAQLSRSTSTGKPRTRPRTISPHRSQILVHVLTSFAKVDGSRIYACKNIVGLKWFSKRPADLEVAGILGNRHWCTVQEIGCLLLR